MQAIVRNLGFEFFKENVSLHLIIIIEVPNFESYKRKLLYVMIVAEEFVVLTMRKKN